MKKKVITTLFIIIAIILLNLIIPKDVKAASSFFDEDITWEWEYVRGGDVMTYGLFSPSTADDFDSLPMIVYLHGSGETAVSESSLRETGLPGALEKWDLENFNAYVLCPHLLDANGYWNTAENISKVETLINKIIDEYNIDTSNIVLCGESRGGTGALSLAYQIPEYFSKCVAFSAFYSGPFNTSMDTICYYSWTADDASKYASSWKSAFGEDRVFSYGCGHGSVGYTAATDDDGAYVRNTAVMVVLTL